MFFQKFMYAYIIICNIYEYLNNYNGVILNSSLWLLLHINISQISFHDNKYKFKL